MCIIFIFCIMCILPSLYSNEGTDFLSHQEKVYLHTDKPFYIIGDTIWLKGYLVDATTHKERDTKSRFLYVELIDRKNKVIQRKKLKEENGCFSNFIALEKNIEEADYQIRAYTHFMRNQGEEFFFTKQILVYANTTALLSVNAEYEIDEPTGDKYAVVTLLRKDGSPYVDSRVEYMYRSKEHNNRFRRVRTNTEGKIRFKIPQQEGGVEPYLYISLYEKEFIHRKRIFLPQDYDYTVGFYPEGGHLLAGVSQQVAFKAEASNGKIIQVEGYIMNQRNDTLAGFKSGHGGIGAFRIQTDKADTLHAIVKDDSGNERDFLLPVASDKHIALAVEQDSQSVNYRILLPHNRGLDEDLGLLVHTRGKIIVNRVVSHYGLSGSISLADFPEGIAHFVVFNRDTTVVSERLMFVRKASVLFQLGTSRNPVEHRKPINLGIRILNEHRHPVRGNFSLSITDDFAVDATDADSHILSNLLLTSDLKGPIHAPGYYFSSRSPEVTAQLDQLLLTHGWKRFDVEARMKRIKENVTFAPEQTQQLNGYLKGNYSQKNIKGFALYVTSRDGRFKSICLTDSLGRFRVEHNLQQEKDFITVFTIQGKGNMADWKYRIHVEEMDFPPITNNIWTVNTAFPKAAYIADVKEGYTLIDGEKVYQLPEVSVNALSLPSGWISYQTLEPEKVDQFKGSTALDLLKEMPGLLIDHSQGKSRVLAFSRNVKIDFNPQIGKGGEMIGLNDSRILYYKEIPVVLDGHQVSVTDDLALLSAEDIESIDLVREENGMDLKYNKSGANAWDSDMGYEWGDSEWEKGDTISSEQSLSLSNSMTLIQPQKVYIKTYLSKAYTLSSIPNVARVGYLSYAKNARFYAPKYPTEESRRIVNSDKRSTIHWEPDIRLNEKGEAGLSFYTADRPSTYTVVIEGITEEGRICRFVKKIK